MSNAASGSSSAVSNFGEERVRVVGMPTRCWCGEEIWACTSKSDANPNRRYFRCRYAVLKKLVNDKHNFKWVDEALIDEFESLSMRIKSLEGDVNSNLFVAVHEAEYRMKRLICIVVVCLLIIIAILKIVV